MTEALLSKKPYKMSKSVNTFCQLVASGESKAEAYRIAYPKAKTTNPYRLTKREDVQKRIAVLKELRFKDNLMSDLEKRDYLARVVRTPITEIEGTDLHEGYGKFGPVMPSKIQALAEDNKIAGSYFADKAENKVPGFSFLIDFARYLEAGAAKPIQPVIET